MSKLVKLLKIDHTIDREKILAKNKSDKGLVSKYTKNSSNSTVRK